MTSTLANKLQELKDTSKRCKFSELLHSMDEDSRSLLQQILSVPQDRPGSVSNVNLVLTLREEGYDIGRSVLSEHRREVCTCYKKRGTK
jgi:Mg/Co/Ni transporter MgtE